MKRMASNYNRKSVSSGSRKPTTRAPRARAGSNSVRRTSSRSASYRTLSGGQPSYERSERTRSSVSSTRVGDINRRGRAQKTYNRYLLRAGVIAAVIFVLILGGIVIYNSSLFTIKSVSVVGVEHLTEQDMQNMAGISAGTTLLTVDADAIEQSVLRNSWVEEVSVNRVFPDTLELVVTERAIVAVVEVPTNDASVVQPWAIASDGMWLMPIPDKDSEDGQRTSSKIYEEAEVVLHIVDVPYGLDPEIGTYCADDHVNNALSIVDGMTTELVDRVTTVKATETESTTLTIKDGPDIVFGTSEYIREKELVCLEIMEQHPEGVAYINVRTVDNPTWRAL